MSENIQEINRKKNIKLIDDYYFLCELLEDDIEMLVAFIKYKKITKHRPSSLLDFFENLRLWNVEKELNFLLDLPLNQFKTFKFKYKAKNNTVSLLDYCNSIE